MVSNYVIGGGKLEKVFLDIMVNGKHYAQLPYLHKSGENYNVNEIAKYIYIKLPSLRTKTNVEVAFSNNRVI